MESEIQRVNLSFFIKETNMYAMRIILGVVIEKKRKRERDLKLHESKHEHTLSVQTAEYIQGYFTKFVHTTLFCVIHAQFGSLMQFHAIQRPCFDTKYILHPKICPECYVRFFYTTV